MIAQLHRHTPECIGFGDCTSILYTCWLLKWVQLHWVHNRFTVALSGHLLVRALIVIWLHVLQRPDRLYLHWLHTHMIAYPVITLLTFFVWCKCLIALESIVEPIAPTIEFALLEKLLQLHGCHNWWQFHWFLNWSHWHWCIAERAYTDSRSNSFIGITCICIVSLTP